MKKTKNPKFSFHYGTSVANQFMDQWQSISWNNEGLTHLFKHHTLLKYFF